MASVTAGASGRRRVVVTRAALVLVLVLVLVAVGGIVGLRWWREAHRGELDRAIGYAPSSTVRLSWTDWQAVRKGVHADLDRGSSVTQVEAFLRRGYDADLTSGSAMVESTPFLQDRFGFSPGDVSWELLAQSEQGSVLVVGLPDSLGTDALGDTFARLGYTPPSGGAGADGVYLGGDELLARLTVDTGLTLSPQFNNLALDSDRHLLLASDSGPYLRQAFAGLGDDHHPGGDGLSDVATAVGEPLSAEIYSGDYACRFLAMGQADDEDEQAGQQLVARAGGVNPLDGFAIAARTDGEVVVALSFDSDDAARHNADSRATLAAGPAPGQGGDFSDRFRLGPVTAQGRVVTLRLRPRAGQAVLSDLSTGPVLFATC